MRSEGVIEGVRSIYMTCIKEDMEDMESFTMENKQFTTHCLVLYTCWVTGMCMT